MYEKYIEPIVKSEYFLVASNHLTKDEVDKVITFFDKMNSSLKNVRIVVLPDYAEELNETSIYLSCPEGKQEDPKVIAEIEKAMADFFQEM